jgi:hypothetical protein
LSDEDCPPSSIDFGNSLIPSLTQIRSSLLDMRIKALFRLIEQLDSLLDTPEITEYFSKEGID